MNNNLSVHSNQSSYALWTWVIALLLAIVLLWALFSGRGPTIVCCGLAEPVEATPVVPITPATSFGFNASCKEFSSTGDAAAHAWTANTDALKTMLCGDGRLTAAGDGKNVVLTGAVESQATKTKIGDDAKTYFGDGVAIDNQITSKASEPIAVAPPPAAKLYFATAKTNQPADSATQLAPIVEWLKANSNAKAVISGFHDSRGSQARNEQLAEGRTQSTFDALVAAGIDAARIEQRKPADVNGGSDLNEARRVEVSVE